MTARILVVDDDPLTLDLLEQELAAEGYAVERAGGGEEALRKVAATAPDVILLDCIMPDLDGFEVVRRLRADEQHKAIPIILVTGRGGSEDKARGLDAGADDYVVKPFDPVELLARVRSMVRIKRMHDAQEQWSKTLEEQVARQVAEIQRLARLKRYVSPQIAEAILEGDEQALFASHRRDITVLCLGLAGFEAFAERAEPEEILDLLTAFHTAMGELTFAYGGTVERLAGAAITVLFNAPVPLTDHVEQAVRMALAMRNRTRRLHERWLRQGHDLDLGVGLAAGYATLGEIGFEGRREYAAIGRVPTLAAGLAEAAIGGQVLTDRKTLTKVEEVAEVQPVGELPLHGFPRPVAAFNVLKLKAPAAEAAGPLSPREREVAVLVARGLSNKEIAGTLFVSERTAEGHIQSILNKLGFHARAQIAAWVIAHGLSEGPQ